MAPSFSPFPHQWESQSKSRQTVLMTVRASSAHGMGAKKNLVSHPSFATTVLDRDRNTPVLEPLLSSSLVSRLFCFHESNLLLLCVDVPGPDDTDSSKELEDLLGHHGVDPSTISSIMSEGWSLPTFPLSATSLDTFDQSQFNSEASALQQARLRVCWREANVKFCVGYPGPSFTRDILA